MPSLPRGSPLKCRILFINRDVLAHHLPVGRIHFLLGSLHRGRKVQPEVSFGVIHLNALAHGVELGPSSPELPRRPGPQLSGPHCCLRHVARKTLATVAIKRSHVQLAARVVLVGRPLVPRRSLLQILGHAIARFVALAHSHVGAAASPPFAFTSSPASIPAPCNPDCCAWAAFPIASRPAANIVTDNMAAHCFALN